MQDDDLAVKMLGSHLGEEPESFLRAKVDKQIELVGNLDQLPAQHALLLFRTSIQLNLRHLERTLAPTPEVEAEWQRLDRAHRAAILRLRGLSPNDLPTDRLLLHLPVRRGGLGVLSAEDCAMDAYAASTEAAEVELAALWPTLPHNEGEVESQHARVMRVHDEAELELDKILTPQQRMQHADQRSPIAVQWLYATPLNRHTMLSSKEIAVGLHYRTLVPGECECCTHCGARVQLGHNELCQRREKLITERHENVKKVIKQVLDTVRDTTVRTEVRVRNTKGSYGRTDLTIRGPASVGAWESHFDVMIPTLFANSTQRDAGVSLDEVANATDASRYIEIMLGQQETVKIKRYGHLLQAFHPLVISLGGGTFVRKTGAVFAHWLEAIGRAKYNWLIFEIGLSLLRAKARFFVL